jgi:hypothetical protein
LKNKPIQDEYYKIQGWTDQINKFSTYSDFQIVEINSKVLDQKRRRTFKSRQEKANTRGVHYKKDSRAIRRSSKETWYECY